MTLIKTITYSASLKGARTNNEDTHIISNNGLNYIWGVFDGHGGKTVSSYLKQNLGKLLLKKKSSVGYKNFYIRNIFNNLQKKLISDSDKKKINIQDVGSTCLLSILTNDKLQIVNVGDCRAVICQKNGLAKALTIDHKPDWINEKKRITKLGGKIKYDKEDDVYRIMDLSVSRAFGDLEYTTYVKHNPDIFTHRLKSTDNFIILACDGLWDEVCSQEAVNYVLANKNKKNVAQSLAHWAINEKKSMDNVSIIIVFFKYPHKSIKKLKKKTNKKKIKIKNIKTGKKLKKKTQPSTNIFSKISNIFK
jgi:serine/threonine protein phosphatase PrpC